VYLATCNYQPALEAFQRAFQCQDSDKVACKDLMDRSKRELAQDIRQGEQLPWVGCALGMVLSSLVIVLDYLSHGRESTLAHPVLKVTAPAHLNLTYSTSPPRLFSLASHLLTSSSLLLNCSSSLTLHLHSPSPSPPPHLLFPCSRWPSACWRRAWATGQA